MTVGDHSGDHTGVFTSRLRVTHSALTVPCANHPLRLPPGIDPRRHPVAAGLSVWTPPRHPSSRRDRRSSRPEPLSPPGCGDTRWTSTPMPLCPRSFPNPDPACTRGKANGIEPHPEEGRQSPTPSWPPLYDRTATPLPRTPRPLGDGRGGSSRIGRPTSSGGFGSP